MNREPAQEPQLGTTEHLREIVRALGELQADTPYDLWNALRSLQVTQSMAAAIRLHGSPHAGSYRDFSIESGYTQWVPESPSRPQPSFVAMIGSNRDGRSPAPMIRIYGNRFAPSGLGSYRYVVETYLDPDDSLRLPSQPHEMPLMYYHDAHTQIYFGGGSRANIDSPQAGVVVLRDALAELADNVAALQQTAP